MKNWFKILLIISGKDILIELKSKEIVVAITLFSLLVVSIFAVTSSNPSSIPAEMGSGIIWASIVFSGSIAMSKFFYHEEKNETLNAILLMPIPIELIFFSKILSLFLFLTISECLIIAVFSILFNSNPLSLYILVAVPVFNLGFSSIGTFFGIISSKSRSNEILLTLLIIPILIPLIMFATELTSAGLSGTGSQNFNLWVSLGISFDIIFIIVLTFLFGKIIEQ